MFLPGRKVFHVVESSYFVKGRLYKIVKMYTREYSNLYLLENGYVASEEKLKGIIFKIYVIGEV